MTGIQAVCFVVSAALVPMGGCFSAVTVHKPVSRTEAEQLRRAAAGRPVTVESLAPDKTTTPAQLGQGGLDSDDPSVLVVSHGAQVSSRIPFEDIRRVVVKERGKGSLEGFLIGAIPGAIAGMVVGSAFDQAGCNDNGSGSKSICPSSATVTMALGGALISGLIGAVVGGAIGHRTTFTFE